MKVPVLILFGPTASGKTALLERLFGGADGDGGVSAEIISADSMQVYRGMDIGTAKPTPEERRNIPHHLIDIRNPDEQFNAGEFVRLAEEACIAVTKRGGLPVVSGGTGFYLKNLVLGLSEAPPSDKEIRSSLREELIERGIVPLIEELVKVDPVSASRIHINDEYRIIRALEVYRLTGRPLSAFSSPWNYTGEKKTAVVVPESPIIFRGDFCFRLVGLQRTRDDLYRRINERTAAMFREDLPGEVRKLFEAGYTPFDPGFRAIGYREFFIENPRASDVGSYWRLLEDLVGIEALVAQNSRRYAKRQITFFSSLPAVKWIDCGTFEDTVLGLRKVLDDFLFNLHFLQG